MLVLLERFLVYPTYRQSSRYLNAAEYGAKDVHFFSGDGTRLHGWYMERPKPKAQVLFLHGNGQHIGDLGPMMLNLAERLGVSIFVFDYRGYGLSDGQPYEEGVLADAEAAQRWLAAEAGIQVQDVVLYGQSLGGGVGVYLASHLGAKALIVEHTFHSMVEIGAEKFPWLPVRWVMRNRYPSSTRIRDYDGPFLQLHGSADALVPLASGRKLFEASPSKHKYFHEEPDLEHCGPTPTVFYRKIEELLEASTPSDQL